MKGMKALTKKYAPYLILSIMFIGMLLLMPMVFSKPDLHVNFTSPTNITLYDAYRPINITTNATAGIDIGNESQWNYINGSLPIDRTGGWNPLTTSDNVSYVGYGIFPAEQIRIDAYVNVTHVLSSNHWNKTEYFTVSSPASISVTYPTNTTYEPDTTHWNTSETFVNLSTDVDMNSCKFIIDSDDGGKGTWYTLKNQTTANSTWNLDTKNAAYGMSDGQHSVYAWCKNSTDSNFTTARTYFTIDTNYDITATVRFITTDSVMSAVNNTNMSVEDFRINITTDMPAHIINLTFGNLTQALHVDYNDTAEVVENYWATPTLINTSWVFHVQGIIDPEYNMTEGVYNWTYNIIDTGIGSNSSVIGSSDVYTFNIDRTAPLITTVSSNFTIDGGLLFKFNVSDVGGHPVDPTDTTNVRNCSALVYNLANITGHGGIYYQTFWGSLSSETSGINECTVNITEAGGATVPRGQLILEGRAYDYTDNINLTELNQTGWAYTPLYDGWNLLGQITDDTYNGPFNISTTNKFVDYVSVYNNSALNLSGSVNARSKSFFTLTVSAPSTNNATDIPFGYGYYLSVTQDTGLFRNISCSGLQCAEGTNDANVTMSHAWGTFAITNYSMTMADLGATAITTSFYNQTAEPFVMVNATYNYLSYYNSSAASGSKFVSYYVNPFGTAWNDTGGTGLPQDAIWYFGDGGWMKSNNTDTSTLINTTGTYLFTIAGADGS